VEAPFVLLLLVRLFLLRELTPISSLFLATGAICMGAFLLELFYGYASRNRYLAWAQLGSHSLIFAGGIWVGMVLLFYAVPAAGSFVSEFFKFRWLVATGQMLLETPFQAIFAWGIFLLLFGMSATLFFIMPSAMATLYVLSGRDIWTEFAQQYGRKWAVRGTLAIATTWIVLFVGWQQQPQMQAFALLEPPPQTDAQRQELLAKSDTIRAGLTNAYLSTYRYISPIEDNTHVYSMYRSVFNLPESLCWWLQDSYNLLMSPFLYRGSHSDIDKAETLYAEFFDTPIQKGERTSIRHALKSTANIDQAKAGLLNIDGKRVWLRSQQVNVTESRDTAEVELHEVYENQTHDVEEVYYSFSLPESAVITGLWLGDTSDRSTRFPFKISPRGAAQKVYNSQVQRSRPIDPALLEQVGPRHYRLRAFPIPEKPTLEERRQGTDRPTEMHLWLTYRVMQQPQGWPLPELGEKRNIYWNKDTERRYNGKLVRHENWLPSFLQAEQPYRPSLHKATLAHGDRIWAQPLSDNDYVLPENQRFAVVLDSSRSMAQQRQQVLATFNWLHERGFADNRLSNNDADLYVATAAGGTPQRIDDLRQFNPNEMTFYGNVSLQSMLQQFVNLRGETSYDGILFVTDAGNYELSEEGANMPKLTNPLWMVHLGSLPPAYNDAMLETIQNSGGGVATDIASVLQRQAMKAKFGEHATNVVDGYVWKREPSEATSASTNGFAPLAARQSIMALSQQMQDKNLAELDAIHAIAKTYRIVSPYSSAIVLVNDEQREALKEAEASKERFDRKVEDGREELAQPGNPMSTSVHEPRGVLGLGVVAIILFRLKKVVKQ
jgi:putative PEP-CTERM system integral membrane protein